MKQTRTERRIAELHELMANVETKANEAAQSVRTRYAAKLAGWNAELNVLCAAPRDTRPDPLAGISGQ
jgi:hypothetical protein